VQETATFSEANRLRSTAREAMVKLGVMMDDA